MIEDKSLYTAKRRFFLSLIFLVAGIIYTISPIDIIPDILGPIGWIDDIFALLITFIYSGLSYMKLKKLQNAASQGNAD